MKLNFEQVNADGLRLYLSHPTYPLCGTFSLSEDNTILAENYISGKTTRQINPKFGMTTVYVALPIGTIPAGLQIKFCKSDGTQYSLITTSQSINIERNTVTELTQQIKCVKSKVVLCSDSKSDNPMATVTVASGEAVALMTNPNVKTAINDLRNENSANWKGGTGGWITKSGNYPIASTYSNLNYLVWKIKAADGHIYYKSTEDTALKYYEINAGMRDTYIKGTFTVTSPYVMSGSIASTTFTLDMSDDITKGNLLLTEFDGVSGKAYGVYAGGYNLTFYASTNRYTPFANIDSKNWYFRNGNEANDVVFTLVATDDLPAAASKACYLRSKWCGLKNDNWTNVYYGYDHNSNINNFYGVVAK